MVRATRTLQLQLAFTMHLQIHSIPWPQHRKCSRLEWHFNRINVLPLSIVFLPSPNLIVGAENPLGINISLVIHFR